MSELVNFLQRPNRAIIQVVAPLSKIGDVKSGLTALRMTSASDLPKSFTKWLDEDKIAEALDQGDCGDCWAMSSTGALGDRFMALKNISGLILNPLITASCATGYGSAGCNGGLPAAAGEYFESTGAVDIHSGSCQSWQDFCKATKDAPHPKGCGTLPACPSFSGCDYKYKCVKGSTKSTTVLNSKGEVDVAQTIANIKTEIMNNGPVVACFFVPWDIFAPSFDDVGWKATNGIFINGNYDEELKSHPRPKELTGSWGDLMVEGGKPAGHAVEIVGWGEGDAGSKYGTVQYWIIKNSWGNRWNKNGMFHYGIYDDKKNINTKIGMDVPVKHEGNYFGGCTQFMPDVATGAPYGHETASSTTSTKNLRKIAVWVGIGIGVLLLLVLLWKAWQWYSNKPYIEGGQVFVSREDSSQQTPPYSGLSPLSDHGDPYSQPAPYPRSGGQLPEFPPIRYPESAYEASRLQQ